MNESKENDFNEGSNALLVFLRQRLNELDAQLQKLKKSGSNVFNSGDKIKQLKERIDHNQKIYLEAGGKLENRYLN